MNCSIYRSQISANPIDRKQIGLTQYSERFLGLGRIMTAMDFPKYRLRLAETLESMPGEGDEIKPRRRMMDQAGQMMQRAHRALKQNDEIRKIFKGYKGSHPPLTLQGVQFARGAFYEKFLVEGFALRDCAAIVLAHRRRGNSD